MRLLVSVRSAAEVRPALAGGADIIDAKEPARGSLGAGRVRMTSGRSRRRCPRACRSASRSAIRRTRRPRPRDRGARRARAARRELYVKLGLASRGRDSEAERCSRPPSGAAARSPVPAGGRRRGVCRSRSPGPPPPASGSLALAARAGAGGVLLDTWRKDGRDLLRLSLPELERWAAGAKRRGLLVGLAGSLSADGVRAVAELPADVVGVRGAACVGGREAGCPRRGAAASRGAWRTGCQSRRGRVSH